MPINYRIDASRVPKLWRDNITPNTDDTGTYYTIDQLCEQNAAIEEEIPEDIRNKYLHDGSNVYDKWVYYSDSYIQTTIPELKVDDNNWLALIGSNPKLWRDTDAYGNDWDYSSGQPSINPQFNVSYESGKDGEYRNCYGFQYTNIGVNGSDFPYGELWGVAGLIYQTGNFSYSDHSFSLWGDGINVYIKVYTPPKNQLHAAPGEYVDTPITYAFSKRGKYYPFGGTLPTPVDTVLVMICGAGGGGRPGSFAANGAGGGSGATGIFTVSLKNTSEEYPVSITLGHAAGSSQAGGDSSVFYTSYITGKTEGFIVGGGGTGRSNEDPGQGGIGGKVKDLNTNPHNQIKIYDYVDGVNGGNDLDSSKTFIGKSGSAFTLRTGKGNSAGRGGNSAFAEGGVWGPDNPWGSQGGGGGWPSAGGGGGKGPSALGGSGGAGGGAFLLITY